MYTERPTNEQLVDDLRRLLTTGVVVEGLTTTEALEATKPWRNELWQVVNEVELRLLPLKAILKERQQNASNKSDPRPEHGD